MNCTPLVPNEINKKHENRIAKQLVGCNSLYFLFFKPKSAEVVSREYLCDCPSCLKLDFDNCDQIGTDLVINMSDQVDRSLDHKEDEEQNLFEFIYIR